MARNIPQTVEDRIRRRERRGRHIRVDQARAISFPLSSRNEDVLAPNSLVWNLRYMLAELYGQVGTAVGDISFAVTGSALTVTFANNTGSGVFSTSALTWTDGTKSWTVDQWAGYYLKVGLVYYKILSNTATALTLDLSKGEWIADTTYTLVPFIPNMHKGGLLNPDTSADRRYKIVHNNETSIFTLSKNIGRGTVTTGDAAPPYDTFRDSSLTGYQDDALNGFSIFWRDGTNIGEVDTITDFVGSTGEIIVGTGFTAAIDVSDNYGIVDNLLYAGSSSEWRTEKYYPLSSSDFTDASPEDIHIVQLPTANGAIVDSRMQAGYAAMYSVEVLSKTQRNISIPVNIFEGSLRVELTDLGTGTTQILYNSGFRPARAPSVEFMLRSNAWHRMDVYLYVADGQIDTPSGEVIDFRFDPLSAFITTWRDVTPSVPTDIVITGANTSNNDDYGTMLEASIEIIWANSIFLGEGGQTEIWSSDTEGGSFVIVTKVPTSVTQLTTSYVPGTTKWYKIRHVSASGNVGPFSSARKGVTVAAGLGSTQIVLDWVDNGGSPVYPNVNGWFNDSVLKVKITVTTNLTIADILFWEPGQSSENLGSSSPATSSAIVAETTSGYVYVLVGFTSGLHTGWLSYHFKYDKTGPDDPVIDSLVADNFGMLVTLTFSYTSDFQHFEWHTDLDNSAPAAGAAGDTDVMGTSVDKIFGVNSPFVKGIFGATRYFWVRARDEAGNVSNWVSSSISLDSMEITGSFELTDLLEMV